MRAKALFHLAQCLHSQTQPDWEEAYASSKQALELYLELSDKASAVQDLTQLVWLCPKCAQPPLEAVTEFCRTVLGILTSDEDKQLRGAALVSLAQCLDSQTPPDWESAAKVYREALGCLTDETDKATRATVLYHLATCLHSQTQPDWEEAYASSKQALELYLELSDKASAVQDLTQLVWLCPKCAQPPLEAVTEFCRTVLGILTSDEDKQQLRGAALVGLAGCLLNQAPPDWGGAAKVYREALGGQKVLGTLTPDEDKQARGGTLINLAECLRKQTPPDWVEAVSAVREAVHVLERLENSAMLESALIAHADVLEDQPTPDLAGAIAIRKQVCQKFPCVNNILGLVMSLDRSGDFASADAYVCKLDPSQLANDDEQSDSPLARRRQAYLGLRRNDLTFVTGVTSGLRGTSENTRAMLLLSLAHFARGEYEDARECVQVARADRDDIAWFRPVVVAYFARHSLEGAEVYTKILDNADWSFDKGE